MGSPNSGNSRVTEVFWDYAFSNISPNDSLQDTIFPRQTYWANINKSNVFCFHSRDVRMVYVAIFNFYRSSLIDHLWCCSKEARVKGLLAADITIWFSAFLSVRWSNIKSAAFRRLLFRNATVTSSQMYRTAMQSVAFVSIRRKLGIPPKRLPSTHGCFFLTVT